MSIGGLGNRRVMPRREHAGNEPGLLQNAARLPQELQRELYRNIVTSGDCHRNLEMCTVQDEGRTRPRVEKDGKLLPGCNVQELYKAAFGGAEDPTYKWLYQGRVTWDDYQKRCDGRDCIITNWRLGYENFEDGTRSHGFDDIDFPTFITDYHLSFSTPADVDIIYDGSMYIKLPTPEDGPFEFSIHGGHSLQDWAEDYEQDDERQQQYPLTQEGAAQMLLLQNELAAVLPPAFTQESLPFLRWQEIFDRMVDVGMKSICANFWRQTHTRSTDNVLPEGALGLAFLRDPALDPAFEDVDDFKNSVYFPTIVLYEDE